MVLQASRAMLEYFWTGTDRCQKGCQGEQNLRLVIYNNDRTYRNSYEDIALSLSVHHTCLHQDTYLYPCLNSISGDHEGIWN